MADSLGNIKGQMILDVKQALNAYTQARQAHISTVTALHTGAGAATAAGAAIAGVGVAMVAGFGVAINAAAEFERKLDFFTAVSNTTQEEFDAIRQKALQLGADTIYSADQIAESFIELGKSGVSARDIINGIGEGVASLGAAADIPLDTAANIITAAVATFSLGADQAVMVADKLAGAANASIVDVQDLGVSLKYAGGIAASLKIPFEDVNTALAILGVNGIKGSTAGTSLRQILLGLNGTTPKATKALKELGIITADGTNRFYDSAGSAKSLAEVMQILKDATTGMSDQQRVATLQQIFATRALPSLIALTKDGAAGFEEMAAAIEKTTALDVASQRLDNLSGDLEILRGNLDTLMIESGSGFQTFARDIVQGVTNMIQVFLDLPENIQTSIVAFIAITGVVLIAIGSFGLMAGAILNLIALGIQLAPVLTALAGSLRIAAGAFVAFNLAVAANPLARILIIVGAIIGALVTLYTTSETFRNAVQPIFQMLVGVFNQLGPVIQSVMGVLSQFFGAVLGQAGTSLIPVAAVLVTLASTLGGVLASALQVVAPLLTTIASIFTTAMLPTIQAIIPLLAMFASLFGAVISGNLEAIPALITSIAGQLATVIGSLVTGLLPAIVQVVLLLVTTLVQLLPVLIQAGVELLLGLVTAITTALPIILEAFLTVLVSLIEALTAVLPDIISAALSMLSGIIQAIILILPVLINAAITLFMGLIDALILVIPLLLNAITTSLPQLFAAIVAAIPLILNAAIQLFSGLLSALLTVLPQLLTMLISAIVSILTALVGALPDIISAALEMFLGIVLALIVAIPQIIVALLALIPELLTALIGAIPLILEAAIQLFLGILTGLIEAFPQIVTALIEAIPQLIDALIAAVPQFLDAGADLIEGLINGVGSMGGALLDAIIALAEGAIDAIKDALGIASPSKVFAAIGVFTIQGLAQGVKKTADEAIAAMIGVADQIASVPFTNSGLEDLYNTVAATRDLERELTLAGAQLGVEATNSYAMNAKLDNIADARPNVTVEKVEINNPEEEPASESLPKGIRKTLFIAGE